MSYASFTKSFPNFIKTVPQKLFQPTSIAVIASVGIHGLVGVALPYLPLSSQDKSKLGRSVRLTQLTPSEQSRLPVVSPPTSPPLSLTQLPQLSSLPPSLSSPFPPPPSKGKDSSLYKFPPLTPLPPLGEFSLPSLPPSPQRQANIGNLSISDSPVRLPPLSNPQPVALSTPLPRLSTPLPPLSTSLPPLSTSLPPYLSTPLPPLSTPLPPLSTPLPPPPISSLPTVPLTGFQTGRTRLPQLPTNPDVSLPLGVQPAPVQDLARNPGPMPKPPQPSGQTPKLPGGVNSAPQVSANPGLTGTPSLSPPVTGTPPLSHPPLFSSPRQQQLVAQRMAELRKLREEITFNPTGTSDEDAKKNYEAFLNQANQTQRVSQPQAEVSSITGTYPKDACLGKLEGTTVVGVVVGADGSATAPQLIRSAGYPVLNQTAMQEVTSRRFENKTGQPKPHQVSVTFNYNKENCPQMVLRDSPRPPIS
ncbi:MAG TPA: TonB family protein, partial [Coleofasciculaceae cyanobacterium]